LSEVHIMESTAEFSCAFCGETNIIFVDISAGISQSYVEDCQICCRPNVLCLAVDEETLDVAIASEPESY
jgi:predicted RNA-binding Zn-ribbon protein involved in translation (DUF1610 family)